MALASFRSSHVVRAAGPNGASPAAAVPRPVEKAKPAAAPAAQQFRNINKFYVPKEAQLIFVANWREREHDMQQFDGFLDFKLEQDGDKFVASSSWASIPEWEAWSLSPECRRSHLPGGIYQWVPGKGEGFPEDFVPFVEYDAPVNAKY